MLGHVGKNYKVILFVIIFFISSCSRYLPVHPPCYPTPLNKTHEALQAGIASNTTYLQRSPHVPQGVSNALLPRSHASLVYRPVVTEKRFNISADKLPAKTFFMSLVEGTPYSMVVNPNVTGYITLELKNVTIHEAMRAVRDAYGYEYKKTPYGYEVLAEELQSEMYNVNYLNLNRAGKTLTRVTSGQISEKVTGFTTGAGTVTNQLSVATPQETSGTSVVTKSEMNFWRGLETALKSMIGTSPGHSVVVNSQAGVVIVHAFPSELHRITRYLDRIQVNMDRQVILEAKVLEVQLKNEYQAGIDWNAFGLGQRDIDPATGSFVNEGGTSQTAFKTFRDTDMKDFASMFTVNIKGNFGALIKLLQTQGNVQVLSSPRLTATNNQKAVIKVGQDEFFVTGVSTNNFVTANATVPTQDVSLTPFFSGVSLDVTPQISSNGEVVLHIHPAVSLVKEQHKEIQLGTVSNPSGTGTSPNILSLPLALSTIRESDNVVRARSGQIIVIGGLMQSTIQEEVAGTPGLSRVPFFGTLFRRTLQKSVKSELVILLRPVIASARAMKRDMEKQDERFGVVDRGFHVGGFPEVFGTEGEREPFNVSRSF